MKYFFYTFLLVASLGTAGAIMNPSLVQQGAALIGLKLPQDTTDSAEKPSEEDQLAQFLAQYPFHRQGNADTVSPRTQQPLGGFELTPPPPPVYAMPAAPPIAVPEPVLEPVAPAFASSNWDGTATEPITPAPPVLDWSSGPSQPYQEPTPAPQQSVYVTAPPNVPPQEFFPAVNNNPPPHGFEQTKYIPPPAQPIPSPTHGTLQTPAVLIEDVPVYGTEMVARVGTQFILMGDVLPKLRRAALKIVALNMERMTEEERANVPPKEIEQVINAFIENQYPEFLQEQILCFLVYNDYNMSKSKAEKDFFNERMGDDFDRNEIPEMMKDFNVENVAALKKYLESQLGSSLERERRAWIREQIVRQWIQMSVQRATGECTADEMLEFYENNQAMFTTTARARWQEMVVYLSNHGTEQEAWHKIRWMGNQVAGGAPFEEIAKANSNGFSASKGGIEDWTTKGSLTSAELEQAIFSQPLGQLSPAIIRTEKGLHIIRVLERKEETITPFVEAQGTIREKIRNQRVKRYQDDYFAQLRRQYPTQIMRERIDFNINSPRTANNAR